MRLAAKLGELALVDLVNGGVVGEEAGAALGQPVPIDRPRGETLPMDAEAGIVADGGEHLEKRFVALPVLLRQIADGGSESRQAGEAWANSAPYASAPSSGSMPCSVLRRTTGGSWKKSPTRTTCMPPNGAALPLMSRQTASTRVRLRAGSIEIFIDDQDVGPLDAAARRRLAPSMSRSRRLSASRTPMPLQA